MSNILTFPTGGLPPSNIRELRNPLFEFPTENVVEPTPGDARRQCRRQSESQTETGKNAKLRLQRREAWWQAERQVEYWKACMNMHHAIYSVQRAALPEGGNHSKVEHWHWHPILDNYRKAVARLLLTPAPTQLNIAWKKKALAAEKHKYTDLSSERVEAAIARDLKFFADHPTRRKRKERSA